MTAPLPQRSQSGEAYSRLLRDTRLSHGAVRLWMLLRDYQNPTTGKCCPSYDTITSDVGCKLDSIRGWLSELKDAGWLTFEAVPVKATDRAGKPGRMNLYTLLDGRGQILPKKGVADTPEKGSSRYSQKGGVDTPLLGAEILLKRGVELGKRELSTGQRIGLEKRQEVLRGDLDEAVFKLQSGEPGAKETVDRIDAQLKIVRQQLGGDE